MKRRRFHQLTFAVAGAYNLAWGAYSAYDPQWLFRYAGMPLANHPEIFACLAMVVGIYGFLYWQVARDPEHGVPIAAIGLLGKVLGPIGLAQLIASGAWPSPRSRRRIQPSGKSSRTARTAPAASARSSSGNPETSSRPSAPAARAAR